MQAYKCLSDDAKRISFNLERLRNQCTHCNRIPHNKNPTKNVNNTTKNSSKNSKFYKIQQHFRAIREQLIQEARVIEGCLRVNQRSKKEYPVFDPSNYTHLGYPHKRTPHHNLFQKNGAGFWDVQKQNVVPNFDQRRGRCEIPVFELRTDCSLNQH